MLIHLLFDHLQEVYKARLTIDLDDVQIIPAHDTKHSTAHPLNHSFHARPPNALQVGNLEVV